MIDGNGNKAELRYDGHDRLSRWVFPSATAPTGYNGSAPDTALTTAGALNENDYEEYAYDLNGNRDTLRNRASETLFFTYDNLNRMILKNRPGSELDVAYSYNARGLQTGASFPSTGEAVTNEYDGFDQLGSTTTTMGGVSRMLSYLYDANGNRLRITHPDGTYFTYESDGLNRVAAIRENGSAVLATIAYDRLGRRASLTRGSGIATSYAYDGASRLASLAENPAGSSYDQTVTLTYNRASQIATRAGTIDAFAWNGLAARGHVCWPNRLCTGRTVFSNSHRQYSSTDLQG